MPPTNTLSYKTLAEMPRLEGYSLTPSPQSTGLGKLIPPLTKTVTMPPTSVQHPFLMK